MAAFALLELGQEEAIVQAAIRSLLNAQEANGCWSEVVGHASTIHNTFSVVRVLSAARRTCMTDGQPYGDVDAALARATGWFRKEIHRRTPRSILDLSYAVRLGAEVGIAQERATERLGRRLRNYRNRILADEPDLYAETEIAALAFLEVSQRLDHTPDTPGWSWRWTLPTLPPPFLARTSRPQELLYALSGASWWIGTVDWLVRATVVDHVAGLLLGTIAALGFVDDFVTDALIASGSTLRGLLTCVFLASASVAWFVIKASAYSSLSRAATRSIGSAIAAVLLTWMVTASVGSHTALISLLLLRWLVIDLVAHTADSSGLINRMLRR